MIYAIPIGGLCNLMFVVAAAISISKKYGVEFCIPGLDGHLTYVKNFYGKEWIPNEYKNYIFHNVNSCGYPTGTKRYEFPFHFTNIHIEEKDAVISGHFQSELYFIEHRDIVLEQFREKKPVTDIINQKYESILNYKITSLHVRRTDYLNYPDHHPLPGIEYYRESIDLLNKDTELFILFSDDLEWAKENICPINKEIKIINEEKDYICMYLMARCHNNIIANSSFSWWGAYLNPNNKKTIIAPQKWFGKAYDGICDYKDVIPKSWIKI